MGDFRQIDSPTWAMGLKRGQIVKDVAAINQSIFLILTTSRGTDPMRPLFGSTIYQYLGTPTNIAIAGIKASIVEALSVWEKRIQVVRVTHKVSVDKLQFIIVYKAGDGVESLFELFIANGAVSSTTILADLILQGMFPIDGDRFFVEFGLDGLTINPLAPIGGFTDRVSMLNFCRAAYGNYGNWYLQGDRLYCRVSDPKYTTGFIKITALILTRIETEIPTKGSGQSYQVSITYGGQTVYSSNTLQNPAEILTELRTNYAKYGDWGIETVLGDFSEDFNNDFLTFRTVLALYTLTYKTATLNITIN